MKYPTRYSVLTILFCGLSLWGSARADNEGPPANPRPNRAPNDPKECRQEVGSAAALCSGNLQVDYTLPAYRSLGVERRLRLVYNSTTADVRPIFTFDMKPNAFDLVTSISARLLIQGQPRGSEVFYRVPSPPVLFRAALPWEAANESTGIYPFLGSLTNRFQSNPPDRSAAVGKVVVNNQRNSPFGAGWTWDGVQRLVRNTARDKNTALILEGDGAAKIFSLAPRSASVLDAARSWDAQLQPNALAVADVNGDNQPDVVTAGRRADGPALSVLLGQGDGTFQTPRRMDAAALTNYEITAFVVGDFDGDGRPDLAGIGVLGTTRTVLFLKGNGDGTFQTPRAAPFTSSHDLLSLAVGDFNGDNRLDVVVTDYGTPTVSGQAIVLLGNGDGTFQTPLSVPAGPYPTAVAVGDFDNDNRLDLAVTNGVGSGTVSLFLGNGDGTFQPARLFSVGNTPVAVAAGDFNQDGRLDLAVANSINGSVSILLRNPQYTPTSGQPLFLPAQPLKAGSAAGGPKSLMVADLNGDGLLDLIVLLDNLLVWLGNGDGTFSRTVVGLAGKAQAAATGDFNGDGNPDVVTILHNNFGFYDQTLINGHVSLLLGQGDGRFATQSFETGGPEPTALVAGDFNGDQIPDLAVVHDATNVAVLMGQGDGAFQTAKIFPWPDRSYPRAVAVGDFNSDGQLDMVVTNSGSGPTGVPGAVSIYLGQGAGTFQAPQAIPAVPAGAAPAFLVVGDFNGDGRPDLAFTSLPDWNTPGQLSILLNNTAPSGPLAFTLSQTIPVGISPYAIAVGRYTTTTGGTRPFLAVANFGTVRGDNSSVQIFLGRGDGTFSASPDQTFSFQGSAALAVGDLNGDAIPDVAVANYSSNNVAILLGQRGGAFQLSRTLPTADGPSGVAIGDFNGDTRPDLAVTNKDAHSVLIYQGLADGSLGSPQLFSVGPNPAPIVVGDFNSDGQADLVVGNSGGVTGTLSALLSPRAAPLGDYSVLVPNPPAVCGDLTPYAYRRTRPDGVHINFDAQGQHRSTVERNCQITRYDYAAGPLIAITDPAGGVTRLDYIPPGVQITDPAGRVTKLTLTAVTPTMNQLTQIEDPSGATTQFQYDPTALRLTQQTNPRNVATLYTYDPLSGRFQSASRAGVTRALSPGQAVGLVGPNSCTPPAPNCGTADNPAPITPTDQVLATFLNGRGVTRTYQTDAFGAATFRLLRVDGVDRITTIQRDGHGNPTEIKQAAGSAVESLTQMAYDALGNVLASVVRRDDQNLDVTQYTYHPVFNLIQSIQDPRQNTTRFLYDDGSSACGAFCHSAGQGNLCEIVDAAGQSTCFGYDNRGRVVQVLNKVTDADGVLQQILTQYVYYLDTELVAGIPQRGNLKQILEYTAPCPLPCSVPPSGRDWLVTTFTYDLYGNVQTVTDPEGGSRTPSYLTTYAYDALNRLRQVTDAQGNTTQYFYQTTDGRDCVTAPPTAARTAWLCARQDARGKITRFGYDDLDRLTGVVNPLGQTRRFQYDAEGNLINIKNARQTARHPDPSDWSEAIGLTYNEANELKTRRVPPEPTCQAPGDPATITYTYDAAGNLVTAQKQIGTTVESNLELKYNRSHQITQAKTLANDSGQPVTTLAYGYDGSRNRTSLQKQRADGTEIYSLTYPLYDALNRLRQLQRPGGRLSEFRYDELSRPTGTVTAATAATSLETVRKYYVRPLKELTYRSPGSASPLLSFLYGPTYLDAYDRVGDQKSQTRTDSRGTGADTYGYDTLYQLTTATHTDPALTSPEQYTYSPLTGEPGHVGNRTQSQRSASYTYDDANRLLTSAQGAYTYDADGNLQSTPDGRRYCFDAENQLTKVSNSSLQTLASYRYDGLGRRIEKNENGTITRYGYDGANLLEVYTAPNTNPSLRVIQEAGIDRPLVLDVATNPASGVFDQSYFYLSDALGSVVKLMGVDALGSLVEVQSYTYDSFGNIVQQTGSINQPFTDTGREWDGALPTGTGLYYYRARYYDPTIGRFISEDPIGFDGDPNFYVYAQNNPINWTDPFGFFSIDSNCKCEGFGEESLRRAEDIAREGIDRITESGIRECIRKKLTDGKVKCGSKKCDKGSTPDKQGRVLVGHAVPLGSTITVCKAAFGDDKTLACTIIHEFAHTRKAREGRADRVAGQAIPGCK